MSFIDEPEQELQWSLVTGFFMLRPVHVRIGTTRACSIPEEKLRGKTYIR
jgi:hypothetical protein